MSSPSGHPSGQARALLYSDPMALDSHRVRYVLAEKGVAVDIVDVPAGAPCNALQSVNPLATVPVLLDRDLVLYDARVIVDYLEERHPHPPLMPDDPPGRARTRVVLHRIEQDWHRLLGRRGGAQDQDADHGQLARSLAASASLFEATPFFLSDTFSVLDAMLAPLLWRLEHYGIVLPETAAPVADYATRMFARAAFDTSLSAAQRRTDTAKGEP